MDGTRLGDASLGAAVEGAIDGLLGEWVSSAQSVRVATILRGFVRFCELGFGTSQMTEVTPQIADAFVSAIDQGGHKPSVSFMHLRRSALRLLFRAARRVDFSLGDPTLDLVLPARTPRSTRALTDDEVTLCRSAAAWSLVDARRSAAWALAEASCWSVEVGQITREDVDLGGRRVWIHGGRTTAARWGLLSGWGAAQLEGRLAVLPSGFDTLVVYGGTQDAEVGQISASIALRDVLVRAGLGSEPGVRPGSVAAWAGQQIIAETGRIDEVARRLGFRSLDRAARVIGWDWNEPLE